MKLGKYYIDLNLPLGEDFSEYEFDREGVPLTRFYRKPNWQYNPITVCQYGLHHFNKYLRTQKQESKEIFLIQAKWLLHDAEKAVNGAIVWRYQFDLPSYKISAPWISGMAQGEALSVLLRAHQLTGDEKYLDAACGAWEVFKFPVDKGGVIAYFPDGKPVIEEYPSSEFLIAVLNGFIFAIFGIYDFALYTDNELAHRLFSKLIDSLKDNLHRYDCSYWSYYDLKAPLRLTSKSYHRLHIEQLNELYEITCEEIFRTFRDRWRNYLFSSKCNFKWMVRKIRYKLFFRI